jgi:hypothetical protein
MTVNSTGVGGKRLKRTVPKAFVRLREQIEAEGGITLLRMWELRDAAGWDRLGVNVVKDIASKMKRAGLATLPARKVLPYTQEATVWVYVVDSRVGEVIDAVIRPSDDGVKVLREVGMDDAAEVLAAVREVVCG